MQREGMGNEGEEAQEGVSELTVEAHHVVVEDAFEGEHHLQGAGVQNKGAHADGGSLGWGI